MAFAETGIIIDFRGSGPDEVGIISEIANPKLKDKKYLHIGDVVIRIDTKYFRPTEVDLLIGDPSKAYEKLGWKPEHNIESLVKDMMKSDMELMKKEKFLHEGGYQVMNYFE
jgi:GDPmannose 4,6-dehydratase